MDKHIARELGVSLNTLREHWRRIRSKMGHETRMRLVRLAYDAREIEIQVRRSA